MSIAPALPVVSRPETAGVPYVTAAEFQMAPTGLQLTNLIPQSPQVSQTQALEAEILRASSWMDLQCHQVLASTTDTELAPARVGPDGSIEIFTRCFPIRAVTAVAIGLVPTALQPLMGLAPVVVLNRSFRIYSSALPAVSTQGLIQFAPQAGPGGKCWVQYSYVNGYPVTALQAACVAGATSLTVLNGTGILAGDVLTLSDIPSTETVGVLSVSGNTVDLTGVTRFSHGAGIAVTSLPDAIKRAAILATSAGIQERGTGALVMASMAAAPTHAAGAKAPAAGQGYLAEALAILQSGGFVAQTAVAGLA